MVKSQTKIKPFEKEFSILECFFILGIPKNAELTEPMLNRAFCKAMQQAHPDKAKCDESSQEKAKERCHMIQHARDILQKLFDGSSDEISSDCDDSDDYDWGSGGEHGDGWGPGFGEDDGYNSDESDNDVPEEMVFEAFEILGLDSKIELTATRLTKAYRVAIMKAHPDKAKPDETSQKKAKELSQKINIARDILKELIENPDGSGTFPVEVDGSDSDV